MKKLYCVILILLCFSSFALKAQDYILEPTDLYLFNSCPVDVKVLVFLNHSTEETPGFVLIRSQSTKYIGKVLNKEFYLYGYSTNFRHRWQGDIFLEYQNAKYPFMRILLPSKKSVWTSTLRCLHY